LIFMTTDALQLIIKNWRKRMAAAGIRSSAIDELEIHLREEIERLVASGRKPAEAYEIALHKIGQPDALSNEFGKNGPRRHNQLARHLILATALGALTGFWLFNSLILPAMVRANNDYYRALSYVSTIGEPAYWSRFIWKGTLGFVSIGTLASFMLVLIHHHFLTLTMLSKARRYVFLAIFLLDTLTLRHSIYDRLFMLALLQGVFELLVLFAASQERGDSALKSKY